MGCNSSIPAKTPGSPHDNLSGGQDGDQETQGVNDNVQHKHLGTSTTQNIYADQGGSKSFTNTENDTEIGERVGENAICAIDKSAVSEGKSGCTNASSGKEQQQKEEIPSDSVEQGEKGNDNDQQQMTEKVEQKGNEGKTTVGF